MVQSLVQPVVQPLVPHIQSLVQPVVPAIGKCATHIACGMFPWKFRVLKEL